MRATHEITLPQRTDVNAMTAEIVTNQILALVRNYCTPKVVTGLMKDLRQSDALERRMMGGKIPGAARGQRQRADRPPPLGAVGRRPW